MLIAVLSFAIGYTNLSAWLCVVRRNSKHKSPARAQNWEDICHLGAVSKMGVSKMPLSRKSQPAMIASGPLASTAESSPTNLPVSSNLPSIVGAYTNTSPPSRKRRNGKVRAHDKMNAAKDTSGLGGEEAIQRASVVRNEQQQQEN
eukprot:scaffold626426_cov43-Prasinocladus_malaysianus.AAC.1